MKIVINTCHGGFGLSEKAVVRYNELKGRELWIIYDERFSWPTYSFVPPEERIDYGQDRLEMAPKNWHIMPPQEKDKWNKTYREQTFHDRDLVRNDPILIQVVEELGEFAEGRHAELKIVEIPDEVDWQIEEYDGLEWIAEKHRTWS